MSRGRDYQTRPVKDVQHAEAQVEQNRNAEQYPQPKRREVQNHRQCQLCYTGEMNGIGIANGTYAKSQSIGTRFYKCDKCGHTWSVTFRPEQIISVNIDDE